MIKICALILVLILNFASLSYANSYKGYEDYYIKLNNNLKMPMLGLGTWTLDNEEAERAVYHAIKTGYRLIDTAQYYNNELGVGLAVRNAINDKLVTREEIFITSKIMPGNYNNADEAINQSLKTLGLDYIDLMLIHQPGYNDKEVYKALERAVKAKKIKALGISNYYTPKEFERIVKDAEIMPAVIQNENHIYFNNLKLKDYVSKYKIAIEAWYPFGGRGHTRESFNNETIKRIAKAHNKTAAQVILRWQIQCGFIVIPGSSNNEHISENFNIFDFELDDKEMNDIVKLNRNARYENW